MPSRPDDRAHQAGRDNGRPGGHGVAAASRVVETTGAATPRQIDAIWKVGRAKGLDPGAVEHMSLRVFNRKPDALTQQEAAGLLRELSNLKRRVA
jgi:hypothetical protein